LLLPGTIAFIVTLIFVPLVRRLCIRWNIYDPTGPLKIHSQAIPRLGGVAITLAFAAGISFAGNLSRTHVWPFFAAVVLIWAAGLADDIWLLSPTLRFAAQIGGAVLLWRLAFAVAQTGPGQSGCGLLLDVIFYQFVQFP
jgi:UDP-GlcNAc:undecaprenyl-phosphate/decaprenyl-phosphate GlcNAc-1-phosphate transferase